MNFSSHREPPPALKKTQSALAYEEPCLEVPRHGGSDAVGNDRAVAGFPVYKDGVKVAEINLQAEWRKNNPFPKGRW